MNKVPYEDCGCLESVIRNGCDADFQPHGALSLDFLSKVLVAVVNPAASLCRLLLKSFEAAHKAEITEVSKYGRGPFCL